MRFVFEEYKKSRKDDGKSGRVCQVGILVSRDEVPFIRETQTPGASA